MLVLDLVGRWTDGLEGEQLAVCVRAEFVLIDNLVVHEVVELRLAHFTVEVVNDVPALHDFSEEILEIVEWH